VGEGGLAYREDEELPEVLDRLAAEIEVRRAAISVPAISDVADRYLETLGSGFSLTSALG
jgi:predicted transcriptional regulator